VALVRPQNQNYKDRVKKRLCLGEKMGREDSRTRAKTRRNRAEVIDESVDNAHNQVGGRDREEIVHFGNEVLH